MLFISSLGASVVLFFQGNYYHMYNLSKKLCCGSQIIHPTLLQDLYEECEATNKNMLNILKRANSALFNKKDRINNKAFWEIYHHNLPDFLENKRQHYIEDAQKPRNQTSNNSPLHNSVENRNYVLYCVLSLLGANFEDKNKEGKSVLEELLEMLDNDNRNFNEMNTFVKWWILKVTDQHWLKLFRISAEKGFRNCLNILIEHKLNVNVWSYKDGNTALHLATMYNLQESVQKLITKNADVNAKNFNGDTPMHLNIILTRNYWKKLLTDNNGDATAKRAGEETIYQAVTLDRIDCLTFLIEKGANVNAENYAKESPLHCVFYQHLSTSEDSVEYIRVLVTAGAAINLQNDENNTPLHEAVKSELADKTKETCCKFLIEAGADLSAKNYDGDTPLHLAAQHCNNASLKCLLEMGANANSENDQTKRPLHLVFCLNTFSSEKYVACLELLIAAGAEINATDQDKCTPLHEAVRYKLKELSDEEKVKCCKILIDAGANLSAKNTNLDTPLHIASTNPDIVILKCLLEKGAIVNEKNKLKQTPLHLVFYESSSYSKNCEESAKVLIEAGADINAKDAENNTPLHEVVISDLLEKEKEQCCQVLIAAGADLSAKNDDGDTSLHLAAEFCSSAVLKVFLETGANVNDENEYEETPLHCASKSKLSDQEKEKCCEILIKYGANLFAKDMDGKTPMDNKFLKNFKRKNPKLFQI